MKLSDVYKKLFNRNDEQWSAFINICELMGCQSAIAPLLEKDYQTELDALHDLNPILQEYLFRGNPKNPLVQKKQDNPSNVPVERFNIQSEMTELHQKVAEQLIILGHYQEISPQELIAPNMVFILGSTVPNMSNRIKFFKDRILPHIKTPINNLKILGLSGERVLIPATHIQGRGYLGDVTEEEMEGFLTASQLEPTIKNYNKDRKPTEAGAMAILAQSILPAHRVEIINAQAKPGKPRPDTEDTAICAGKFLHDQHIDFKHLNLVIISDACFPGQKEQIISGLLQAGIHLRNEQIKFYGAGYSIETFIKSPDYIQILVSSLAEQIFNTMNRLKLELSYQPVVTQVSTMSFMKPPKSTADSDTLSGDDSKKTLTQSPTN